MSEEQTKMGRPRKEMDWNLLDSCCEILCTEEECAALQDMSVDTMFRRIKEEKGITFAEYYKQKSAAGKMSLRRKQFTAAMEGDKTLMVWLGKNWLGQTDKTETEHKELPPLTINVVDATPKPDLS
jgi:hypothetical protein